MVVVFRTCLLQVSVFPGHSCIAEGQERSCLFLASDTRTKYASILNTNRESHSDPLFRLFMWDSTDGRSVRLEPLASISGFTRSID